MICKNVLKVVLEKTEVAQLEWLDKIPPVMLNTIDVSNEELGCFELSISLEAGIEFSVDTEKNLMNVVPTGYFKVNTDFVIEDQACYLSNTILDYEIPFVIGESGEVYELGVDYLQVNDPVISFELVEVKKPSYVETSF